MRSMLLLTAAAVLYVLGGVAMKQSEALTVLRPSILVYLAFAGGATLQTLGMSGSRMSIAYAIVLGLEAVLALAFAATMLSERVTVPQLVGTALVVAGIIVLKVNE